MSPSTLRTNSSTAITRVGIHNTPHKENLVACSGNEYENRPGQGAAVSSGNGRVCAYCRDDVVRDCADAGSCLGRNGHVRQFE